MNINEEIDHFNYSNFIAENHYNDEITKIKLRASSEKLNEADITAITQNIYNSAINHMNAVVKNIQSVWSKFSANMTDKADQLIIQRYKKYYDNTNFNLAVPVDSPIPIKDGMDKLLNNIRLPEFKNDDAFLASLDDKDKFIADNLKDLVDSSNPKLSMSDIAKNMVQRKAKQNEIVGNSLIKECIDSVNNNKTIVTNIQNKLNIFSNSEKTIEGILNASKSAAAMESFIFREEDGDNPATTHNNPNPMPASNNNVPNANNDGSDDNKNANSYHDADPNAAQKAQSQKNDTKLQSRINTYISITTQVLSAEMSAAHAYHSACMKLITEYGKVQAKEAGDTTTAATNNNNSNQNNKKAQPETSETPKLNSLDTSISTANNNG